MGKTTKPLTLIVTEEEMLQWPEYIALEQQGHKIIALSTLLQASTLPDNSPPLAFVIGPRAHYMVKGMEGLLPHILTSGRATLYEKKGKVTHAES